jgi:hypothetical protein
MARLATANPAAALNPHSFLSMIGVDRLLAGTSRPPICGGLQTHIWASDGSASVRHVALTAIAIDPLLAADAKPRP